MLSAERTASPPRDLSVARIPMVGILMLGMPEGAPRKPRVGRYSGDVVLLPIHLRGPKVFEGFHIKIWTAIQTLPFQCWARGASNSRGSCSQHWKGRVATGVQILVWKPLKTFGRRKWIRAKTPCREHLPTPAITESTLEGEIATGEVTPADRAEMNLQKRCFESDATRG